MNFCVCDVSLYSIPKYHTLYHSSPWKSKERTLGSVPIWKRFCVLIHKKGKKIVYAFLGIQKNSWRNTLFLYVFGNTCVMILCSFSLPKKKKKTECWRTCTHNVYANFIWDNIQFSKHSRSEKIIYYSIGCIDSAGGYTKHQPKQIYINPDATLSVSILLAFCWTMLHILEALNIQDIFMKIENFNENTGNCCGTWKVFWFLGKIRTRLSG